MKKCLVKVKGTENYLSRNMRVANSFLERMLGLMFKNQKESIDGMLIRPCQSIHTFFMRFPLTVIFLNKQNKIIKIIQKIKPWRMTGFYFKAFQVLEIPSDQYQVNLEVGDELEVLCLS